jgi:hypothetical protein
MRFGPNIADDGSGAAGLWTIRQSSRAAPLQIRAIFCYYRGRSSRELIVETSGNGLASPFFFPFFAPVPTLERKAGVFPGLLEQYSRP